MRKYFLRLFQYNSWANRRVLGVLEHDTPEDPTPLKLFAHILAAEKIWLNRLRYINNGSLAVHPDLPVEGCRPLLAENVRAWTEFIQLHPEDEYFRILNYRNTKGEEFSAPVADIMAHVANHGTYHRGQIARALRQAGLEPPSTDFIIFSHQSRD